MLYLVPFWLLIWELKIRANPVQEKLLELWYFAPVPVRGSCESQRSAHSPNLGVDASTIFRKRLLKI